MTLRHILETNFAPGASLPPASLADLLPVQEEVSTEGLVDTLKLTGEKLIGRAPKVRSFRRRLFNDQKGLLKMEQALQKFYGNEAWLASRKWREGEIDGKGIANYVYPADSTARVQELAQETDSQVRATLDRFVEQDKNNLRKLKDAIDVLHSGVYFDFNLKRVEALLNSNPRPQLDVAFPLSQAQYKNHHWHNPVVGRHPILALKSSDMPAMVQAMLTLIRLTHHVQKTADEFEVYRRQHRVLEFPKLDDFMVEAMSTGEIDAELEADRWYALIEKLVGETGEGLYELDLHLHQILRALALWVDRSMR